MEFKILSMLLALALIAIFFTFPNFEIHSFHYQTLDKQLSRHPDLEPLVSDAMSDGKITFSEYWNILDQLSPKQRLINQIGSANHGD
ncbi:hypothetical protein [Vibrio metschnikovii]|uniref:hypothetical protein n=2 Tax=Vibrio TaxID=662 RepID=UPI001302DEB5|nr:hypothetical protein [Vibrio metschnikovii]EKO3583757.1 hypothetical protein [Vibrio metschnikovii]